ncbi:MAG: nucleotidyltransferase domain-containing protein [Bacteroidia bacterium]
MIELEKYHSVIEEFCRLHNVRSLYLFGSALTYDFNDSSDIDLLVSFDKVDPVDYFDNYISFKNNLENTFHRKIDLLEEQALKNPVLIRSINRNKKLLYGRTN